MIHKKISYKDAAIHYSVSGKGMPVVLLHGFGEDGTVWDSQVAYLKDRYRMIIPDIPGSGRSGLLEGNDIGMEEYADCIKAIIKAENISSFVLIGHSMGGYMCLAYVEKYPKDIAAFGLFHSTSYPDDEAKIETREKAISFIETNGSLAFLKTSIPGLFKDPAKNERDINILLEKGAGFTKEALIQYYRAMINRVARTAVLKESVVPVLFIAGIHDKAVPFSQLLQQTPLPRLAYLHVLRQSGHMGMLEEQVLSNEILANFLDSVHN